MVHGLVFGKHRSTALEFILINVQTQSNFNDSTKWNSILLFQEIIPTIPALKNDRNMITVTDYTIDKGKYAPVHPITKNFF